MFLGCDFEDVDSVKSLLLYYRSYQHQSHIALCQKHRVKVNVKYYVRRSATNCHVLFHYVTC